MNEDRIWFLLARNLSGEASSTEKEELDLLLRQHPAKQYLADIISTYFKAPVSETETENAADINRRLQRIILSGQNDQSAGFENTDPAENKKPFFRIHQFLPYAAAIMAIGITWWMVYQTAKPVIHPDNTTAQTSEVVARPGARTKLVLPDGTQVWLNSGSRLHYNNEFNKRLREVNLEGEAFFDVVADASHPFIVHTSALNVKVLGTAFNVKSYPKDAFIETTLLRGLIEISRKDDPSTPKVILKANEKLIFNKNLIPVHMSAPAAPGTVQPAERMSNLSITPVPGNVPDSDKAEISWMYNKLVFDGDSFEELAAKMERWYNVKITFENNRLLKYRFKGVFNNETIQQALDALRLTARFTYTITGNDIMLNKE